MTNKTTYIKGGLCYSELVLLHKLWGKSNQIQKRWIISNLDELRGKSPMEIKVSKTDQKETNSRTKLEKCKGKRTFP